MTLLNKGDTNSAIGAYIASMSWSFTTISSVGYGDIYPVTNVEKIFGIISMIISCGMFSYIVGAIASVLSKND
jgi:hyperpolarization activated cyclic nucleotide-gated potassium channel 2